MTISLNTSPPPTKTAENVSIRLAETEQEIEAAQRLRYNVFYEEYGAKASEETKKLQLDKDDYDDYADHLIVIDHAKSNGSGEKIVGTYRLLRRDAADRYGQFYTSDEFDLSPLLGADISLLELGRSCVLPEYRTRPIMQLLWQGIADYITDHNIELMFGCASLHTTEIDSVSEALSYLHHNHLAPENLRPRALNGRYIDMNIIPEAELNMKEAFKALPPLIKGYLRLGATIGDGAVIDEQFNTTDVCIVVQTNLVTDRYRKHYERKIQKTFPVTGPQALETIEEFGAISEGQK